MEQNLDRFEYLTSGEFKESGIEKQLKEKILAKLRLSQRLLKCFNQLYLDKYLENLKQEEDNEVSISKPENELNQHLAKVTIESNLEPDSSIHISDGLKDG
jgi:hypothetical protein